KGKGGAPAKEADKAPPQAPATTTTTTSSTTEDKPVGPQLQSWRQTARADFSSGKFSGASVTAGGELRLTPSLRRLASTTETYIWALVPDGQDGFYAGTGTGGKILKIDAQGKTQVFATLPVVSVQSLALGKDGTLWAGSGVQGRLYRIRPDGTFTLTATLPEKYLMALTQDSKGDLFIGPGDGGAVYRLSGPDGKPAPYFKSSADRILALAVDAQDALYVGTGPEGILYKVTPDGKSSVLFDARENSITALAVDAAGVVYAGTGPKGVLYRIAPDGTATTLYDRASAFYTALRLAPDGSLYAATVNALYHILPSATPDRTVVQPLDNPNEVDFLTLALLPGGGVAAGTGNVGEVYASEAERGGARSGTYESVVHDAKFPSRWGSLRWDATVPAGTGLRIETRSGNVAEPDATWSPWTPVQPDPDSMTEGIVASPPARFIQYRLTLTARSEAAAQPAVREVSIDYVLRSAPPAVAFQAPQGGERWSKTQTIRWNASDPNSNTLTYALFYSGDGGATWKPLPSGTKANAKPDAASAQASGPATSVEALSQQLDAKTSNMPPALKQMILDNYRRRLEAAGGPGALKETSKSWDTTALPDGTYQLKVVASDRLSNPSDPQTGEAISQPFLIVNATPQIHLPPAPIIGPDKSVAIEGDVTQALIAVTAVQYRVDGGDWIAATSRDGLFDSSHESFAFVTLPLPSGKHTIEV
ncbi:MAG TPA: hypothetical protein VKT32_17250, partial [Chthonomonadaceae bacterium]|nr:hypothetical protein [Chthonomonadaceae bacterium]